MPHPVKGLGYIENCCSTIMAKLKVGRYRVGDSMALMDCGVRGPETKLVVGDNALEIQNGDEAFEKNFLKNFSKNREEGDRAVR